MRLTVSPATKITVTLYQLNETRKNEMKTHYNKQQRFGFGGFWIDKDKLFDAMFTGACIFTIVASAIFGTWALLVTMSL